MTRGDLLIVLHPFLKSSQILKAIHTCKPVSEDRVSDKATLIGKKPQLCASLFAIDATFLFPRISASYAFILAVKTVFYFNTAYY